jgi:hypothetical protein
MEVIGQGGRDRAGNAGLGVRDGDVLVCDRGAVMIEAPVLICLIGFMAGLVAPAVMLVICLISYRREIEERRRESDDYVQ